MLSNRAAGSWCLAGGKAPSSRLRGREVKERHRDEVDDTVHSTAPERFSRRPSSLNHKRTRCHELVSRDPSLRGVLLGLGNEAAALSPGLGERKWRCCIQLQIAHF